MTSVVRDERIPVAGETTLGAVRELLARFHAEDVLYCHWKSNEHLRASMLGQTDFDLLFDRQSYPTLARIAGELEFKRFAPVPSRAYPGIEDYLGMDPETGTLVHLHVHWRLTLGERYIKGYRLPWEQTILAQRVFDEQEGIFTADPALEALLLVTRMVLKIRLRDRLASWAGRPYFVGGALRELRWLADRLSGARLFEQATPLVGEAAARRLVEIVFASVPSMRQLVAFRESISPPLAERRTYGPWEARLRRWGREATGILARRTLGDRTGPAKRVSPRGGLLVALVGADGAGKSTLSRETAKWLGGKLDVAVMYGGSGVGSAALPRRVLKALGKAVRPQPAQMPGAVTSDSASTLQEERGTEHRFRWSVRSVGRVLNALALDRERRERLTRARRLTNLGMIVVSDRYPQNQFVGFNDGPWLAAWTDRGPSILRWAARRERASFRLAEASPPDLVIKLLVPFDVAAARKRDTPPSQLRRKITAVRALRFPTATRVVEIDADAPLAEVLLAVKQAIWESL